MQVQTEQLPYESLGRFISFAASFEYLINAAVESVVSNHKLIDHIQRQSLELRIEFLKHNIFLVKSAYDKLTPELSSNMLHQYDTIAAKLDELMTCYAEFKPYRDLTAHSPLVVVVPKNQDKKNKIISSRRHKPKSNHNSLEVSELNRINSQLAPKLDELQHIVSLIQGYCSPILGLKSISREIG